VAWLGSTDVHTNANAQKIIGTPCIHTIVFYNVNIHPQYMYGCCDAEKTKSICLNIHEVIAQAQTIK